MCIRDSAANLEHTDRLQVFEFEVDLIRSVVKIEAQQRCSNDVWREQVSGRANFLQCRGGESCVEHVRILVNRKQQIRRFESSDQPNLPSEDERRNGYLNSMTGTSVFQYLSCLVWQQTPVDGVYHLAGFVLPDAGSSYEMASG